MSKFYKLSLFASIIAIALSLFASLSPVQAEGTFDLEVYHRINGRSLGAQKELPVDVFVNGGYVFTFEFGESFSAELPAGNYFIEVKLSGTDIVVMSLGPTDIPAGVSVAIRATLGAQKTPTLRVNVK
jgi:hypothetical protein